MAEGKRENKAAIEHSGLMQIDIDGKHLEDKTAVQVFDDIKNDKYLVAVFISPSGTGVKGVAVIPKNIDGHKAAFLAFESYFKETYGLKIDPACKEIARTFFVSYDPGIMINWAAERLELRPKTTPANSKQNKTAAN